MWFDWLFCFSHSQQHKSYNAHNVVMSIGKAKELYKELIWIAHPDRNLDNIAKAQEITALLNEHRKDYAMLLKLKQRIDKEL